MNKTLKLFQITYIATAILFGFFWMYRSLSKLTGIAAFSAELFFAYLNTVFYLLLFLIAAILGITAKTVAYKHILFLVLVFVMASIFVVTQAPQERITRFNEEIQNHKMLNSLTVGDVSFIVIEDVFLTQPEQISPIVTALNSSTWYVGSRRNECIGKEVQMVVVIQTGQVIRLHVSRFCNEDAVALMFIKPLPSGFASGGEAYVPKLPSVLKTQGYEFPMDN